jgi:hypothetical protein
MPDQWYCDWHMVALFSQVCFTFSLLLSSMFGTESYFLTCGNAGVHALCGALVFCVFGTWMLLIICSGACFLLYGLLLSLGLKFIYRCLKLRSSWVVLFLLIANVSVCFAAPNGDYTNKDFFGSLIPRDVSVPPMSTMYEMATRVTKQKFLVFNFKLIMHRLY